MHVVKTTDTNIVLKVIPRNNDYDNAVLELINEETKEVLTPITSISDNYSVNGTLAVDFTYTFSEFQRFSIKLSNENGVIYRGKLICIDENTQDFKQIDKYYTYEY